MRMPPPKKPKNETSWEEFMTYSQEDCPSSRYKLASAACRSDYPCSNSPMITDFEEQVLSMVTSEEPFTPEDLSLKAVDRNNGYRMASDNVQAGLAYLQKDKEHVATSEEKRHHEASTTRRELPNLQSILLGTAAADRVSSGAQEQLASNGASSESFWNTQAHTNSPQSPSTFTCTRERQIQVALTPFTSRNEEFNVLENDGSISRWASAVREDRFRSRPGVNNAHNMPSPLYIQRDTCNSKTGNSETAIKNADATTFKVDKRDFGREPSFSAGENGRSCYQESLQDRNSLSRQVLSADSTTQRGPECTPPRRQNPPLDRFASRRQPLRLSLTQDIVYEQRKAVRGGLLEKALLELSFPPATLGNKHSEDEFRGSKPQNVRSPPFLLSSSTHPNEIPKPDSKRHLRALLCDDHEPHKVFGISHHNNVMSYNGEASCLELQLLTGSAVCDGGAALRMRNFNDVSRMDQNLWRYRGKFEAQENENSLEKVVNGNTENRSSPEMPSSSCVDNRRGRMETDEKGVCRCQICDDVASGFHYGVWSCEGCKAFFKRSLHGPVDYICPSTNNCTIDKLRRKSCQACRLRKCHEAGMTAGTSRKDKGIRPMGKKRKAVEEELCLSDPEAAASSSNFGKRLQLDSFRNSAEMTHQMSPTRNRISPEMKHSPSSNPPSASSDRSSLQDALMSNSLIERLLAIEFSPRMAEFDNSVADSKLQLLCGLLGLINFQLVDIITWSKSLPDFSKSSLEARTRLLVSSWSELLILGTVWQSLPYKDIWVCAPNLHLTRDHCKVATIDHLFVRILVLIHTFQRLQLTQQELVLLRLTILLNSDAGSIETEPPLANLQNLLDETWQQIAADGQKLSQNRVRHLLLTLPDIRQCSIMMLDVINNIRHQDGVPAFDLLHEMLDSDVELVSQKQPCHPNAKTASP